MKESYPHLNSAAFVLECTKGRGQLMDLFTEHTKDVCSYRRELLGLMAIHLILLAVNKCTSGLTGSSQIYSDCLGALNKVKDLSPISHSHSVQPLRYSQEHHGELQQYHLLPLLLSRSSTPRQPISIWRPLLASPAKLPDGLSCKKGGTWVR